MVRLRAPIESEWMITLPWIVCLDIHISATLTACSLAKVIGSGLGFASYFFDEAGPGCGSVSLGTGIGVDVELYDLPVYWFN